MDGFQEEGDEVGSVVVAEEGEGVARVVEDAFLIATNWTQQDSSSSSFVGIGTLSQQL